MDVTYKTATIYKNLYHPFAIKWFKNPPLQPPPSYVSDSAYFCQMQNVCQVLLYSSSP